MVNESRTAERALALSYAPADVRAALDALFALDEALGDVLRTTREPAIGQMRLTWWFEALERLDREPAPAQPVLRALAAELLPRGVSGAALAAMIDGWEAVLLDEAVEDATLEAFARARGGTLFAAAARVLDVDEDISAPAGEGWALADLAGNLSRADAAARARAMATRRLDLALRYRWPRRARALGALAVLARSDLRGGAPGGPARVARMLRMRLTGR